MHSILQRLGASAGFAGGYGTSQRKKEGANSKDPPGQA
jgi:hypothetical protein